MICARYEREMREHAHGAPLSPALEAHLASCAVCQDVLATEQRLLAEIDSAIEGVGRIEPSPIFLARARAAALEQPLPSSRRSRLLPVLAPGPIWALPALVAAVLIAALVARTRPSSVERSGTVVSAPAGPSFPGVPSAPAPLAAEHSPARAAALPSSSPRLPSREALRPTESREGVANPSRSLAHASLSEPALVPPGQADALVRLAVLIDAGSVAPPAMLLEPPDPDQELRPPADLHLRPLSIEPLVDDSSDNEGDTL